MSQKILYIRKIALGLMTGSVLLVGPSLANDEVKENPRLQHRHNVMEIVKYSLLGMKAIISGDVKDQSQFPELAASMANAASVASKMFKEDTRELEGKTDAKDKIWANWEDFSKRMDAFNSAAQELAVVAKEGDMNKNIIAFKNTAKNCKACHDEYQKEHDH
jgi:cytochrome c556